MRLVHFFVGTVLLLQSVSAALERSLLQNSCELFIYSLKIVVLIQGIIWVGIGSSEYNKIWRDMFFGPQEVFLETFGLGEQFHDLLLKTGLREKGHKSFRQRTKEVEHEHNEQTENEV